MLERQEAAVGCLNKSASSFFSFLSTPSYRSPLNIDPQCLFKVLAICGCERRARGNGSVGEKDIEPALLLETLLYDSLDCFFVGRIAFLCADTHVRVLLQEFDKRREVVAVEVEQVEVLGTFVCELDR